MGRTLIDINLYLCTVPIFSGIPFDQMRIRKRHSSETETTCYGTVRGRTESRAKRRNTLLSPHPRFCTSENQPARLGGGLLSLCNLGYDNKPKIHSFFLLSPSVKWGSRKEGGGVGGPRL